MDLAGIELFAALSERALDELRSRGIVRRYAPGEVLWQAGDRPTAVHVVIEGEVRVVRASGGRQRVVHHERRGGTLGDVALFAHIPFPATAIAATRVTTVALSTEVIHAVIAADPRFAERLLRGVAQRVRHLIDRLDQLTSLSVNARVARHLLQRANGSANATFTLGMTQQQLAEEVGTVREVIVRSLRELRDMGLIDVAGRGRFRITDSAGLDRIAADQKGEFS